LERRRSWSGKDGAQRRSAQARRARKIGETPCAARLGQRPLARFGYRIRARSAQELTGAGVAGQEQAPLRRVAEGAERL